MNDITAINLCLRYKICESLACSVFICTFAVLPLLSAPYLMAAAAAGGVPAIFFVYFKYLVDRHSLSIKGYLRFGMLTVLLAGFVMTFIALTYAALGGFLGPFAIEKVVKFAMSLISGTIAYSAGGSILCFIPGLLAAYVFGSKIRPVMRDIETAT